ncbi:adrenoceptor alpha 1Bb [Tachysurus ichikawai]
MELYLKLITGSLRNIFINFNLLVSFNADLRPPETVFKFVFWLGYFNSCVNPVIYPCYSREFRRAFARILRCRRRGSVWRTFPPHGTSSCQTRKDSRDSMENFGSYVYGSPCPSPAFRSKSPFPFLDHGHFHPRSRNNSVFAESVTTDPRRKISRAAENIVLKPSN